MLRTIFFSANPARESVGGGFSGYFALGLTVLTIAVRLEAGTFVARAGENFLGGPGAPVTITRTFGVIDPTAVYTIRVYNGGRNGEFNRVSSAIITLNGKAIIGSNDFNQQVGLIERAVPLSSTNVFTVEIRSSAGRGLTIEFIGVDDAPPRIVGSPNPPPNPAGWNNADVRVAFACSDTTSGVAECAEAILINSEGANQSVTGRALDHAGNSATTEVVLNLDKSPPSVIVTAPPANAAGWYNSPVTVQVACTDSISGIAVCEPERAILSAAGANQRVIAHALDWAGNLLTSVTHFNIDPGRPDLVITSPADDSCTTDSMVTVSGTVTDADSGIASLTVDMVPVAVQPDGSFNLSLALQNGFNTFAFVARDLAGNTRHSFLRITRAAVARYPFPQHVVYSPGTIFPSLKSLSEQADDVRLFYDKWKSDFLAFDGYATTSGHPKYRVAFTRSGEKYWDTVSEGQGYGLVIVALMAGHDPCAQKIFDGLWEFSREHPSNADSRLMGWKVPSDPASNYSAFDGDADIAYGLLLADKQWGSGGRINYLAEAGNVIAAILQRTIGPASRLPMLGDWVQADQWVNPDPAYHFYNQFTTRTSDFILGHFHAFGRATFDISTWTEVVLASKAAVDSLQLNHSPNSGLLPDFTVPVSITDLTPQPAPPLFLETVHDGHYYYNATRVPWRLGADALLNNDPQTLLQVRKLSAWAEAAAGGDPSGIQAGYQLNGNPLYNYFTTVFAAPLGVAAMTSVLQQGWLDLIYASVSSRHENYYEDSVTLLCLLVMTRNYWDPTTVP